MECHDLYFTGLVCECSALQVQCCARWATEKVYYIRKAIHIALVMRYKHQNVLFYKSLNMVCVLKSYNIVLCKDPCEHKSLWIYNLPLIIIYVKRNKSCWSFTASSFQVETAVKYSTQTHCKYVPPPTFLLNWKKHLYQSLNRFQLKWIPKAVKIWQLLFLFTKSINYRVLIEIA